MFVPGKPFQTRRVFVGEALAIPANTRLGWKGLPGTDTLAYYENLLITAVKSFIVQALFFHINGKEANINTALDGSTYPS